MYLYNTEVLNLLEMEIQDKKIGQSAVLSDPFINGFILK